MKNETKKNMRIQYVTRYGNAVIYDTTHEQALARLAYLDESERVTLECAPTDSGATRDNYTREATAIRSALTFKPTS